MNENLDELRHELELATAGRLPIEAELPQETSDLREGWLAFGQLLDASDRAFDANRILAGLAATPSDRSLEPARQAIKSQDSGPTPPFTRLMSRFSLSTAFAAAAVLVVGVGLAMWIEWGASGERHDLSPVAENPDAQRDSQGGEVDSRNVSSSDMRDGVESAGPLVAQSDEASATAWDDSFDERAAAAHQRLWQTMSTTASSEVRYESLRQAVEQVDSELNSNSL